MSNPQTTAEIRSDVVSSDKPTSIDLTAYTSGPAVIREVRTVKLPKGKSKVYIGGLPKSFVGGSQTIVSVGGSGKIKFGKRSLRLANLTGNALLQKSVGSEITLIEETKGGSERKTTGKLEHIVDGRIAVLTVKGKTVVMPITSKYELGNGIPAGLSNLSILAVEPEVEQEGTFNIKLLYEATGINWTPVYELFYDRKKGTLDRLACFLDLPNESGTDLNATVKLIAGHNHSDAANRRVAKHAAPQYAALAGGARGMQESFQADAEVEFEGAESETVGDAKMYKLTDEHLLENGVPNNPALFVASGVPVKHEYHSYDHSGYDLLDGDNTADLNKVGATIKLRGKNNKDNKLGTDMPAASVRVFEPDSQGEMQKTQTASVDAHVSVGEDFCLTLRNPSKDIKVTRQLISFTEDPEPEVEEETETVGKKKTRKTIKVKPRYRTEEREIVVYNFSDDAAEVHVHDSVGVKELDWLKKSHDFITVNGTGNGTYVVKVAAKSKSDDKDAKSEPGTFKISYNAKWRIN